MDSALKVSLSRQFDLVKSRGQLVAEKRRKSERAKLRRKKDDKKKKKGRQLVDADSLLEGKKENGAQQRIRKHVGIYMITDLGFYVKRKLREFAPHDKRESVGNIDKVAYL